MSMIQAVDLSKDFRVFERREGLRGAVRDLFSRQYRTQRAVDRVSFAIEPGERVGYIGPNGAGKSTTLKMLTGILVPTSGRVEVAGFDPHRDRDACLRRLGAVFGQRSQLWWDLAPVESYRLLASIYGVGPDDYKKRLLEMEEALGISAYLRTPVRKLSLGEKMRCELAAALLHSPDVVFLDEPTIGLDLVAKEGIRRFLLEENRERNTTFILTTHDLSDIEELCERVIVIDRGRMVFDGSLDALKRMAGGESALIFRLAAPVGAGTGTARALQDAGAIPGAVAAHGPAATLTDAAGALERLGAVTRGLPVTWTAEDGALRASFDPTVVARAEVIRRALDAVQAADIAFAEPRIEDVIRTLYSRGEEEARA
jgi:ABC-2 type transport system ATP-binding protein